MVLKKKGQKVTKGFSIQANLVEEIRNLDPDLNISACVNDYLLKILSDLKNQKK